MPVYQVNNRLCLFGKVWNKFEVGEDIDGELAYVFYRQKEDVCEPISICSYTQESDIAIK